MWENENHVIRTRPKSKTGGKRTISVLYCVLLVSFLVICYKSIAVTRATVSAVSIVDAENGAERLNLTASQHSIGDSFSVNVTIADAVNLSTWQVRIGWSASLLGFVSMTLPTDNIFADKNAIVVPPQSSSSGSVLMGAVIGPGQTAFSGTGTVAQLKLMIKKTPEQGQTLRTDIKFENIMNDTFLLEPILNDVTADYSWNDAHYEYFGDIESVPFHDVAVTNIVPTNTRITAGSTLSVSVTVTNTGTFTETFAVRATANMADIAGSQTATSLISDTSSTLTFLWNTSGWSPGDYTLAAVAELSGDALPSDNVLEYGAIYVMPPGGVTVAAKVFADPLVLESTVIGQDFTVNVNVSGVLDLYVWQAGLVANSSSLKCTGFYNGDFLSGNVVFVNATYSNETMGNVHLVGACLIGPVEGVSGSGQLAHLTFTSLEIGIFDVQLTDLLLLDAQLEDIPFEVVESLTVSVNGTNFEVGVTNNLTGAMDQHAASGMFNTSFSVTEKKLSFDALTTKDWFCQVSIPKELLSCNDSSQWTVKIDGSVAPYVATENGTHNALYFSRDKGYHSIEIVGTSVIGESLPSPDFGSYGISGAPPILVAVAASVCLVALLAALVDLKKTRNYRPLLSRVARACQLLF